MDYGQKQEKDGEGTAHRAAAVHRRGRVGTVGEDGEKARKQLEHRVSRGVTHLQLIGRCYELSAVPETGRRFYSREIYKRRDSKNRDGHDILDSVEQFFLHIDKRIIPQI